MPRKDYLYSCYAAVPQEVRNEFTKEELIEIGVIPPDPPVRTGPPDKKCAVCGKTFARTYQDNVQWSTQNTCGRQHATILRNWMKGWARAGEDVQSFVKTRRYKICRSRWKKARRKAEDSA